MFDVEQKSQFHKQTFWDLYCRFMIQILEVTQSHIFLSYFQDFYVVLLSPSELDSTMKMLLQVPLWAARVIYIQGSALKDGDLSRCR